MSHDHIKVSPVEPHYTTPEEYRAHIECACGRWGVTLSPLDSGPVLDNPFENLRGSEYQVGDCRFRVGENLQVDFHHEPCPHLAAKLSQEPMGGDQ